MSVRTNACEKLLLVGDNPFLGVSHLSQERAQDRGRDITEAAGAGEVLATALGHGATGYLFSVGDLSLSMLEGLRGRDELTSAGLYPIAPWSFDYVRAAVRFGGLPGLAKQVAGRILRSGNLYAAAEGLRGAVTNDLGALYDAYMTYELSRVRAAAGDDANIRSLIVHEIVTDMALGFDMEWLFRAHLHTNRRAGTTPGYNTRNLPYLVQKFRAWGISLDGAIVVAPFNAEGFQMCPSREECEATLADLRGTDVIAMSIFAAGHLDLTDALEYVATLPNLRGVAVGVSKASQAQSTFRELRAAFDQVAA